MADQPQGEKKIIIDEDWKEQAQREKESLQQKQAKESPATAAQSDAAAQSSSAAGQGVEGLPPPTLLTLLTTLATQAMLSLGQIPHPATNQPQVDLEQAHYFIELLAMLEQKTAGNRAPEESALLENILHELRMAFVAIRDRAAKA